MDTLPILRVKYVLTTHYVKLVVTALIFVGICTVLLLTTVVTPALAVSPVAEDPQRESATHLAGVSQEATVTITNSTDAFTEGQTLEDRSTFPLRNASAPVITARGDAQDATINTIEVRITYTASSTGNAGDTFYTKKETVATKSIDGASGTLETIVDIRSVFETKDRFEDEFGSGVTVTPTIETVVTYQYSSSAGRTQTRTVAAGGEITAVGELYTLPGGADQQRQETGQSAIDPMSPLANITIGAVGVVFIVLFGTTLFIGRRGDPTDLTRRVHAKRYDEWVTVIESYTPSGEPTVVKVQTMAGLVNLAIDIHERVLYTPQLEEYIVMDQDTMYKYRSEESDIDGGSEFFGFSDNDSIPDIPEVDADGTPVTAPSPNGNNPFDPSDPDSETGSDPQGDA